MRVLAPEHCFGNYVTTRSFGTTERVVWGPPIGEDTIDVPDYFCQATSGHDVNDVVHAKIVDQDGHKWTKLDQWAVAPSSTTQYRYPQVFLGTDKAWYLSLDLTSKEFKTIAVDPSINYKGKKAKKPVYYKTVTSYRHHGLAFKIQPTASYNRRYREGSYEWFCEVSVNIYICGCYEYQGNVRHTLRYAWMSFRGTSSPRFDPQITITQCYPGMDSISEEIRDRLYDFCDKHRSRIDNTKLLNAFGSDLKDWVFDIGGLWWESALSLVNRTYTLYNNIWFTCADIPIPADFSPRQAFILNEPEIVGEKLDPYLLGKNGNLCSYWRNYLCEHALKEACESLPRLSDNSIQNLLEIVGFIKAAVVDHRIEMPKSLADAWLAYRYQYQTTKLDINDAIKFVHRHMDLGTLDRQIVGRGYCNVELQGVSVSCRCSVEVTPKHLDRLKDLWRTLDQYGLTPDFYVIWDTIPYSFMVDWFLPISDIVSVWDANAMYFSGEYYTLSNICYSITYNREFMGYPMKCYTRWAGSVPSSLNSMYWFDPPSAGNRTWGKRLLDAASIFIGR